MKKIALIAALLASNSVLASPVLLNSSFEINNLNGSPFIYGSASTSSGWTLDNGGGISDNSTPWSGFTPYGADFAFLQLTGIISQTFSNALDATYSFTFYLRQRTNYRIGGAQTVSVLLDSKLIWSGTPADTWTQYSSTPLTLAAGSHTLSFVGTNLNSASDTTAFVDNINMSVSDPVPEPGTLSLIGLSLAALLRRRR